MFISLSLLIITACEKLPVNEETPPVLASTSPIRFNIGFKEEALPFSSTKSMPPNPISEPQVSEPVSETAQYNQIEYIVYKGSEITPMKKRHYTSDDENFGVICDSLPEGNYKIAFLAYSSPHPVLTEKNIFSCDSVSDTFFLLKDLEVQTDQEIETNITLQRIVSRIEFIATDPIPSSLAQFDIRVNNYANQFDILKKTGGIGSSETFTFSHIYTVKEIGTRNTKHSFYSFIPGASQETSVTLNALDGQDNPYFHRTIKIHPQINKIIRYTGQLYTVPASDDIFNVEVNNEWEETINNDFPEIL